MRNYNVSSFQGILQHRHRPAHPQIQQQIHHQQLHLHQVFNNLMNLLNSIKRPFQIKVAHFDQNITILKLSILTLLENVGSQILSLETIFNDSN